MYTYILYTYKDKYHSVLTCLDNSVVSLIFCVLFYVYLILIGIIVIIELNEMNYQNF